MPRPWRRGLGRALGAGHSAGITGSVSIDGYLADGLGLIDEDPAARRDDLLE